MQCHTFRIASSCLTTSSPHYHGSNPHFILTSSSLKTAYSFIFDILHRFGATLAMLTSVLICPSIFMCHIACHSTLCLHLLAFCGLCEHMLPCSPSGSPDAAARRHGPAGAARLSMRYARSEDAATCQVGEATQRRTLPSLENPCGGRCTAVES